MSTTVTTTTNHRTVNNAVNGKQNTICISNAKKYKEKENMSKMNTPSMKTNGNFTNTRETTQDENKTCFANGNTDCAQERIAAATTIRPKAAGINQEMDLNFQNGHREITDNVTSAGDLVDCRQSIAVTNSKTKPNTIPSVSATENHRFLMNGAGISKIAHYDPDKVLDKMRESILLDILKVEEQEKYEPEDIRPLCVLTDESLKHTSNHGFSFKKHLGKANIADAADAKNSIEISAVIDGETMSLTTRHGHESPKVINKDLVNNDLKLVPTSKPQSNHNDSAAMMKNSRRPAQDMKDALSASQRKAYLQTSNHVERDEDDIHWHKFDNSVRYIWSNAVRNPKQTDQMHSGADGFTSKYSLQTTSDNGFIRDQIPDSLGLIFLFCNKVPLNSEDKQYVHALIGIQEKLDISRKTFTELRKYSKNLNLDVEELQRILDTNFHKYERHISYLKVRQFYVKTEFTIFVVTRAMFQEAVRNMTVNLVELTHVNIFPGNIRMFLHLPVYREGYLHRKETKRRLY